VLVVVSGYGGSDDSDSGEGRNRQILREGDRAMMVHGGGNKAERFLEVSVLAEGGRKGVIWFPKGRFGRDWRRFVVELWHLLVAQSKLFGAVGVPSLAGLLLDAPFSVVAFGRSFVVILRSTTGIEVRVVDFKVCYLRSLNLFPVSSCFELELDGLGLRSAVDCSELESLPTPLVAAAGFVSSRKKKKGKISIIGLLRLLGQIQRKLDRVHVGVASKPNRRRKWVCILGLTNSILGWVSGSVFEVGSDQNLDLGLYSDLGHYSNPGQYSDPGSKLGSNLEFVSNSLPLELVSAVALLLVPSSGLPLVSEAVLELLARSSLMGLDSGHGPSLVEFSLSWV
jgi:hypothetical protein